MRIQFLMSMTIAALAAAAPAAAQQPQPQGEDIVVTGQKDDSRTISDFVKALTPVTTGEKLGRFEHDICPAVQGLAKPQADAISDRIRLVAKSVGLAVGKPGCAVNLMLIVTPNKAQLIAELNRHRPEYLGDLSGRQIREIERSPSHAAAWQMKGAPIAASGMELYQDPGSGAYTNRTIDSPSRISEAVRPQFDSAVVVVERKTLAGLTITQLADYVAVRALTGADPDRLGNAGAPTILHVLDVPMGGAAPITMTQWDLAFLKGYYDVRRTLNTGAQRSAIAKSMGDDVHRPHGD